MFLNKKENTILKISFTFDKDKKKNGNAKQVMNLKLVQPYFGSCDVERVFARFLIILE